MKKQLLSIISIFVLVITLIACEKEEDSLNEELQNLENTDEKVAEEINAKAQTFVVCFNEYDFCWHQIIRPVWESRCPFQAPGAPYNSFLVTPKQK